MRKHRNGPQDKGDWSTPEMPIKSITFPLIPLYRPNSSNLAGYFWTAYGYLIPFLTVPFWNPDFVTGD